MRSLALLIYCSVVRSFSFFLSDPGYELHDGVLMTLLRRYMDVTGVGGDLVAIFLIFLQAILINRFVIIHRMALQITLLPGLFYILLTSFLPSFQYLSPELIANTFIILSLSQIAQTYRQKNTALSLFNSGLFCGLAMVFQPTYGMLFFWILIAFTIYNSFSIKRLFQVFIALLVPLFWYVAVKYMTTGASSFPAELFSGYGFFDLGKLQYGTQWFTVLPLLFILIWTLLAYTAAQGKRIIKSRKAIDMTYWLLFFAAITLAFQGNFNEYNLLLALIPVSIVFSFQFSDTKYLSLAELGHFILFLFLLMTNAYQYFEI